MASKAMTALLSYERTSTCDLGPPQFRVAEVWGAFAVCHETTFALYLFRIFAIRDLNPRLSVFKTDALPN